MGSWHGTCALTNLPIRAGDKVRGFILIPREGQGPIRGIACGGVCYSDHLFYPLTLSIKGRYDDSGSMTKIATDANTAAILEWANDLIKDGKLLVPVDEYAKKVKNVRKFGNIANLIKAIERGKTPYGLLMVHEGAFNTAVNATESTTDVLYYVRRDSLKKHIDQVLNYCGSPKNVGQDLCNVNLALGNNHFLRLVFSRADQVAFDTMFASERLLSIMESSETSIDDVIDHMQFIEAMGLARKLWVPQAGAGSHFESYDMHRKLAEFTLKHVAAQKRAHLEEIGDDPEEIAYVDKLY